MALNKETKKKKKIKYRYDKSHFFLIRNVYSILLSAQKLLFQCTYLRK